jgi:hypothetical protein
LPFAEQFDTEFHAPSQICNFHGERIPQAGLCRLHRLSPVSSSHVQNLAMFFRRGRLRQAGETSSIFLQMRWLIVACFRTPSLLIMNSPRKAIRIRAALRNRGQLS